MKSAREFVDNSMSDAPVRGFLHEPDGPAVHGLVLTHGAGSNCQSPLLVALAGAFCRAGWAVLRCDLPFRQQRPHGPPPRGNAERDQAGLRAAVAALRRETGSRVFLGGHSYGGRQASMLAAAEPGLAEALLLLSYPLHPPGRPDVMRTAHLPDLRTPALFVHGTDDGFGSIDEMEEALRLIPARSELVPIAEAGHELMTRKNRGELPGLIANTFANLVGG
jgi:predicted alpha/beta-hydrolase family hydrolase